MSKIIVGQLGLEFLQEQKQHLKNQVQSKMGDLSNTQQESATPKSGALDRTTRHKSGPINLHGLQHRVSLYQSNHKYRLNEMPSFERYSLSRLPEKATDPMSSAYSGGDSKLSSEKKIKIRGQMMANHLSQLGFKDDPGVDYQKELNSFSKQYQPKTNYAKQKLSQILGASAAKSQASGIKETVRTSLETESAKLIKPKRVLELATKLHKAQMLEARSHNRSFSDDLKRAISLEKTEKYYLIQEKQFVKDSEMRSRLRLNNHLNSVQKDMMYFDDLSLKTEKYKKECEELFEKYQKSDSSQDAGNPRHKQFCQMMGSLVSPKDPVRIFPHLQALHHVRYDTSSSGISQDRTIHKMRHQNSNSLKDYPPSEPESVEGPRTIAPLVLGAPVKRSVLYRIKPDTPKSPYRELGPEDRSSSTHSRK